MSTVTGRIAEIKQPWGGYLRRKQFDEVLFQDGKGLYDENIHASVIGMAVEYLTRYLTGSSVEEAFEVSIQGYLCREKLVDQKAIKRDKKRKMDIYSLCKKIKGLDDESVIAACQAVTYDMWYRNAMAAFFATDAFGTKPNWGTIRNIQIMVERCLAFWKLYGPVLKTGFTFENEGYSKVVDAGDGDFLTKDTLWDFQVSKRKPTSKKTLQVLMYWIMGQHSGKKEFREITKIGIFNPRLNVAYIIETEKIPIEIINIVENDIICYE